MATKRVAATVYRVTYLGELGKRKEKVIKATEWGTSEGVGESQVLMFANNGTPVFGLQLSAFLEVEEITEVAELLELSINAKLPKPTRQGRVSNSTTPKTVE